MKFSASSPSMVAFQIVTLMTRAMEPRAMRGNVFVSVLVWHSCYYQTRGEETLHTRLKASGHSLRTRNEKLN